jgi:Flp pilus assembly secretin CpaC
MSNSERSRETWALGAALVALLALAALSPAAGAGADYCPPCPPRVVPIPAPGPGSSQALVLEKGRSIILRVQPKLAADQPRYRVAVVDPTVIDVTAASQTELIVQALELGQTMMYLWDKRGLNKYAVSVVGKSPAEIRAEQLSKSLGPALSVRVFNDTTVIVEGEVKDDLALNNLNSLLQASSDEQAKVVSMVGVEGMFRTPAARAGNALSRLLDPRLEVTTWGESSLMVEGELANEDEALRARQLISAFSEGLKVVDLITVSGQPLAEQAPVRQIERLLGEGFRVTQLRGNVVAVDGQVESREEFERVERLLQAFAQEAQTINLVQIVPPRPDLVTAQSALQAALGEQINVKLVGQEALMIEGSVPSEQRQEQVTRVLALFEGRVPIVNLLTIVEPDRRQVLVAVKVLDINRGETDALGVDWGQYSAQGRAATFRPQPFLFGRISGVGWDRLYEWGMQIHALIQQQRARVLSEPNLLVNEGEEATIHVGGEIPIPVAQTAVGGAAAVSVEWKQYGVILTIKPTISPDGEKVQMLVSPEVSSLDYGNSVTIGGLVLPAMRTRKTDTTITVPDGGVLAIGGLIQSDQSKAVDKIPILGDLPIIGQLFRHDTFITNKSELIILATPQILGEDGQPLHPIPLPEGVTQEQVFDFSSDRGPLPEVEFDERGHWKGYRTY